MRLRSLRHLFIAFVKMRFLRVEDCRLLTLFLFYLVISCSEPAQSNSFEQGENQLKAYRQNLDQLRQNYPNVRKMPDISFFLFGMGDRKKFVYKNGCLKNAASNQLIRKWNVKRELIIPSEYSVRIETEDGNTVTIQENEKGVSISERGKSVMLTESRVNLPRFENHAYGPVLRVLHHEILINVNEGLPVPNFMVYNKPWYRDASLMAMVMKETDNLHLINPWINNIRDPFDRNNKGTSEADNLGQVLFLISLVSDRNHPAVQSVLDSSKQFYKGNYIEGMTDYSLHPVYQTKWLKYGLKSLGLDSLSNTFRIPKMYDSYSSLFWWEYKEEHTTGNRFDEGSGQNYPYLNWAEDHFFGENKGMMTDKDYPLSWEANASEASYQGLSVLDSQLVYLKLAMPHTWHAAEMFLLLIDKKK